MWFFLILKNILVERSTLLTHRTDAPSINENEIINKSDVEKNKVINFFSLFRIMIFLKVCNL